MSELLPTDADIARAVLDQVRAALQTPPGYPISLRAAEVMAALTAAAERERVLREALEGITTTAEQHTMRGFTSGQIWTYYEVQGDVMDAARAALEATS